MPSPERAAALYVHIPYCLSRCPYCDFNTYAAQTWPEERYARALAAELAWFGASEPFRSATVTSIFFGGGTPSLFQPETIAGLIAEARRELHVSPDVEITLEANPGTVERERLAGFREAGVNRLSLGVQSFQPALLTALGRRHSVDDSREALRVARRAGFQNLSLDLIYAVPGESLDGLVTDLDEATSIGPEHISAYALTYEPGTPMQRDLARGAIRRAPEELEATMFETVRARLAEAGYLAYEISNHARPEREARHNQAYWRGIPYLGLGAGAHSFSPGEGGDDFGARWSNRRDPNRYMEDVERTGHATVERETRSRAQSMGEFCWLGLRESRGIAAAEFEARFGTSLDAAFPHLDDLLSESLVERREGRIALTPKGVLVADGVFAMFFDPAADAVD